MENYLHFAALKNNQETVLHILEHGFNVNDVNSFGNTALHWSAFHDSFKAALVLLQHGINVEAQNRKGLTALHNACTNNSINVARLLIQFNADVNAVDQDGNTALHFAVMNNRHKTVSFLAQNGADLNLKNSDGRTPLHFALSYNCKKAAVVLIDHGADFSLLRLHGVTALQWATVNDKEVLLSLINRGANVNAKDGKGSYLLHWAVDNNPDLVPVLIQYGANINVANQNGMTALHLASVNNPKLAIFLIEHGANVNLQNQYGNSALHLAAVNKQKELSICLLKNNADVNANDKDLNCALHKAVEKGHKEIAVVLLEYNADVNAVNRKGESSLILAVKNCNSHQTAACSDRKLMMANLSVDGDGVDEANEKNVASNNRSDQLVQRLVENGANINIKDKEGNSAMHYAIENIHEDVTLLLLNRGADADAVNKKGNNPLHLASAVNNKELACLVVKHVSDIEIKNSDGETCLHIAAKNDTTEVAAVILNNGAHVNSANMSGNTPLHCACMQATSKATTGLLLSKGADVNCRDKMGRTALHFAVTSGAFSVASQLIEFGAKVNATDDCGNMALHHALSIKKLDFVNLFLQQTNINVNALDENCNSPFHLLAQIPIVSECTLACKKEIAEVAKQLTEKGSSVNARNLLDQTPLHLARSACTAEILLENGAWPNAKELHSGDTPLLSYTKALNGMDECMNDCKDLQAMIDMGMKPWIANENGRTVLGTLLEGNHFQASRSLIYHMKGKRNCAVNNQHSNCETLLHVICSSGKDEALELLDILLESRANVNAQNASGETPLHLVCRNILRIPEDTITRTTHFWAVGRLTDNGADVNLSDSKGVTCLRISQSDTQLCNVLKSPANVRELPQHLKWSDPKSHNHNLKISAVVKGKMSYCVQSFHYHKDPIGYGSYSHVYAGVDAKDGREVAVKRIEKDRLCRSEDQREISSLVKLCNCDDVVRYYCCLEDSHFVYIILELMEGTLDEFFDIQRYRTHPASLAVELCKDVVRGLHFFHELRVLHRDIKPDNILYKIFPRICLKIADFGLSTEINAKEFKSVIHSCVGTRCWMAPELLIKVGSVSHSFASDVFACGLVLHYIMEEKKHPFASKLEMGNEESTLAQQIETERNVIEHTLKISDQLTPEARDLVERMLCKEEKNRPATSKIISHPLFWSRKKKTDFLVAVGNQQECRTSRFVERDHSLVEKELEECLGSTFCEKPWDITIYHIYAEMTSSGRRYDTCSPVDLLRFIRNANAHVSDPCRSNQVKQEILENIFLDKFPSLLINVYNIILSHGWDKDRAEIKSVLLS